MELRKFIATTIREYLNEQHSLDIEKYSILVKSLMTDIESSYDIDLFIYYNKFSHTIILDKIVVDKKNRGRGIGTNVMNKICDFADEYKLSIALTPSSDFGGSKTRLIQFYKNFGFKKNKEYKVMETMIRTPS
jgi:GNAT superfamily N-acetyltransferase